MTKDKTKGRKDPDSIPIGEWEKKNYPVSPDKGKSLNQVNAAIVKEDLKVAKKRFDQLEKNLGQFRKTTKTIQKAVKKNGWQDVDEFNRW